MQERACVIIQIHAVRGKGEVGALVFACSLGPTEQAAGKLKRRTLHIFCLTENHACRLTGACGCRLCLIWLNSVMRHKKRWCERSNLLLANSRLVASTVMVAAAWAATCHLEHMLLRIAALRQLQPLLRKPNVRFLQ